MSELTLLLRLVLAAVLLSSGASKLASIASFKRSLRSYPMIGGPFLAPVVSTLTPLVETLAGLSLLLGLYWREAALLAGALVLAFSVILVARAVSRLERESCGCGGLLPDDLKLGEHLVLNAAIVIAAASVASLDNTTLATPFNAFLDASTSTPGTMAYFIAIGFPILLLLLATSQEIYRIRTLLHAKDEAAGLHSPHAL